MRSVLESRHSRGVALLAVLLCLIGATLAFGQDEDEVEYLYNKELYQGMKWRNIGPFRGGRVTTVAGVPENSLVYYMGATGGGVWKTEDAGNTWKNSSDKYFKTGSVGALAVAVSDANVIFAGMGEAPVRGVTTSHGDGVYKSTDGGKTWIHLGLEATRQISKIQIHPENPDIVFVAAQGHVWGPNPERGIYRSKDGGKSWVLVHHVDDKTGASDLSMDVTNPRILYAAYWQHQRRPWQIVSGGPGSGIYKSTDGGDSWTKLSEGLPELMGKIGVAVSPANAERVWAIIEADDGGLFRSDDAGKKWRRINDERILRARSWYYTHITADPIDDETVYVINAPLMKSTDGGKTFTRIQTPHGDNHGLWINPNNNKWMINCNDGGANISFNGGKTWSTQSNQPTAQFYRVITDNRFPYYVYGGQQDNSTVAIASRTSDAGISREDWYPVGGCESAHVAFDPDNPLLVYAGCYQGQITEYNHELRQSRAIMAYPYLGLGSDAKEQKYRFNWNAPIITSPHDRNIIYHAGNVVLKSVDRGDSWHEISPDLTRNEEDKQGKGGAPITNEAAGAENYNTILYLVESAHEAGTMWVGTDDGLVHLTKDAGQSWQNVTPKNLGEMQVNAIEVSPHDPATAYLAVTGFRLDDYTPHVFKTDNYGKSWKRLVKGFPQNAFVRVVREDPESKGLLYAGTELGLYVSFNDGKLWQPFQLNLPVVPITDLTIRNNDLVAATQGRAFWILDDLSPLHQIDDEVAQSDLHLFKPRATVRMRSGGRSSPNSGANPPAGVILHYYLKEAPDTSKTAVTLEILDSAGELVRTLTAKGDDPVPDPGGTDRRPNALPVKSGMNRFSWNLRRDNVTRIPKQFIFGNLLGYRVATGNYEARLTVGDMTMTQPFEIVVNPNLPASTEAFAEQQKILAAIWLDIDTMHRNVNEMREVRDQVKAQLSYTKEHDEASAIRSLGDSLLTKIEHWEGKMIQPRQKTFQDVINFPNQLSAHFVYLLAAIDSADPPVTKGAQQRYADLQQEWAQLGAELNTILHEDIARFNALFQERGIPAVVIRPAQGRQTPSSTMKK